MITLAVFNFLLLQKWANILILIYKVQGVIYCIIENKLQEEKTSATSYFRQKFHRIYINMSWSINNSMICRLTVSCAFYQRKFSPLVHPTNQPTKTAWENSMQSWFNTHNVIHNQPNKKVENKKKLSSVSPSAHWINHSFFWLLICIRQMIYSVSCHYFLEGLTTHTPL